MKRILFLASIKLLSKRTIINSITSIMLKFAQGFVKAAYRIEEKMLMSKHQTVNEKKHPQLLDVLFESSTVLRVRIKKGVYRLLEKPSEFHRAL